MVMVMIVMLSRRHPAPACIRDLFNRLLTAAGFCDKRL